MDSSAETRLPALWASGSRSCLRDSPSNPRRSNTRPAIRSIAAKEVRRLLLEKQRIVSDLTVNRRAGPEGTDARSPIERQRLAIRDWIRRRSSDHEYRLPLLVQGTPGSGKSTSVAEAIATVSACLTVFWWL